MFARATLVEIDTTRISVEDAVEQYRANVLPALGAEPGYRGALVLSTEVGKGLVLTFWDTAEQAEGSPFYSEVLQQFLVLFRSPPGRERYEVRIADLAELVPPVTG